jgi:hypothetical protein
MRASYAQGAGKAARGRARAAKSGIPAANGLSNAAATSHHGRMRKHLLLPALAVLACAPWSTLGQAATPPAAAVVSEPSYVDGKLEFPRDYRQWIFLTSGFDMSYSAAQSPDHHMFDNVFVDPASWRAFQANGTWPDKTMLVVEARGAQGRGSINQAGQYQDSDVMGLEVHVKDTARFSGQWAFFAFNDKAPARRLPVAADCYSCHEAHGAVDTTFVQFYPTLLPLASAKATLSAAYLAEEKARK